MQAKTFMGLFIVFLMVASIFGVALDYFAGSGSAAQTLEYNDYTFRPVQGLYQTTLDGKQVVFNFFPQDLEYIQITDDVKTTLASPVLTVTYDPASTIANGAAQAQYYLETQLDGKTVISRAVTNNSNFTALAQQTCADATPSQPVLFFALSNHSGFEQQNNCITLHAVDDYDLFRQTERALYTILGIMP